MACAPVLFFGDGKPRGAYLLRICVTADTCVTFGKFGGGRGIDIAVGDYCYVGSALGRNALPTRLLRHATRAGGPPHAIREELARSIAKTGWAARLPAAKRLRWNVDWLIERREAEIVAIAAFRCAERIEGKIARRAVASGGRPVARGLGAHDDPGATHLLRMPEPAGEWWEWFLGDIVFR